MLINLSGFLEGFTREFMKDLWTLIHSASESPGGVPKEFLENDIKVINEQYVS